MDLYLHDAMLAQCVSVRPSVNGWTDLSGYWYRDKDYPRIMLPLCRAGVIRVSPKIRVLPARSFPETLNFADFSGLFCHGTSIVAGVVNVFGPPTVATLS